MSSSQFCNFWSVLISLRVIKSAYSKYNVSSSVYVQPVTLRFTVLYCYLQYVNLRIQLRYNPRQSRTLFEIFEWGHETKISWMEEYVFGMCFNFCVFNCIYLLDMSASLILQITSTFTNSEFVPIWYIRIAISAIGILCIKQ